jgi:choline-glycine betaine transporter
LGGAPVQLGEVMDQTKAFFLDSFGWFYPLAASFFLLFALFFIFSKYEKKKISQIRARYKCVALEFTLQTAKQPIEVSPQFTLLAGDLFI